MVLLTSLPSVPVSNSCSLHTQNCDLTGCDLQHANLRGSNLAGAILEDITAPLHMSQTVNVTTVHAANLPIQFQGTAEDRAINVRPCILQGGSSAVAPPAAQQDNGRPSQHEDHDPV